MAIFKIALLSSFFAFMAGLETGETSFYLDAGSNLSIAGSSNVNKFKCNCTEQFSKTSVQFEQQDGGKIIRFSQAGLHIRSKSLDCGNPQMNKDMYKTLRADQHPSIRIELTRAQLQEAQLVSGQDWTTLKASSQLTIAGVTKPVLFEVKAKRIAADRIRLTTSKDVLLTDFGMEPPTAMLGLVKVNNTICIKMDLIVVMV
jgi:polyisoprenoid-binding protein YceI